MKSNRPRESVRTTNAPTTAEERFALDPSVETLEALMDARPIHPVLGPDGELDTRASLNAWLSAPGFPLWAWVELCHRNAQKKISGRRNLARKPRAPRLGKFTVSDAELCKAWAWAKEHAEPRKPDAPVTYEQLYEAACAYVKKKWKKKISRRQLIERLNLLGLI